MCYISTLIKYYILLFMYSLFFFKFNQFFFLQQLQAKFYENIITTHRLEPSFFRVGFYGMAFPSFLQVSVLLPTYTFQGRLLSFLYKPLYEVLNNSNLVCIQFAIPFGVYLSVFTSNTFHFCRISSLYTEEGPRKR